MLSSNDYHSLGPNFGQSLLNEEKIHSWNIPNLDNFFSRVYMYWLEKGFYVILASRVISLLTLGFTIIFSTFLLLFINWGELFACAHVDHDCNSNGIINNFDVLWHPSLSQGLVWTYFIIFSIYWCWHLFSIFYNIRNTLEMRSFFQEQLKIYDHELPTMEWHIVMERVVKIQETLRLCIVKDLSELEITNRILRKDNFLVALINMNILKYNVPNSKITFFGKALEWNLRFCILNYMFDNQFLIHRNFKYSSSLKHRFIFIGILNLILMPFIMMFMIIFFFLRHAEEFHRRKDVFGRLEWTTLAKWKLREYNELSHFFQRRIQKAIKPAEEYIHQFPMILIGVFAQFISYIAGAFVAILLVFGFINSKVLTQIYLGERTLFWWLAIFSAILAVSRGLIPNNNNDIIFKPIEKMEEVIKHTHYMPKHWINRTHTIKVRREFESLITSKLLLLFEEVLCVVVTPFVLCFSLPQSADNIIDFVLNSTVNINGVGAVCAYALFDFKQFGDPKYLAPIINDSNNNHKLEQQQPSHDGKMEKSFLTFAMNHPHWNPDPAGSQFLTNMASVMMNTNLEHTSLDDINLQPNQMYRQDSRTPPPSVTSHLSTTLTNLDMNNNNNQQQQQQQQQQQHQEDNKVNGGVMSSFSELLELRASMLLPEMSRLARSSSKNNSKLIESNNIDISTDLFLQLEKYHHSNYSINLPALIEEDSDINNPNEIYSSHYQTSRFSTIDQSNRQPLLEVELSETNRHHQLSDDNEIKENINQPQQYEHAINMQSSILDTTQNNNQELQESFLSDESNHSANDILDFKRMDQGEEQQQQQQHNNNNNSNNNVNTNQPDSDRKENQTQFVSKPILSDSDSESFDDNTNDRINVNNNNALLFNLDENVNNDTNINNNVNTTTTNNNNQNNQNNNNNNNNQNNNNDFDFF